jgi:uncharacterized protein YaaQ
VFPEYYEAISQPMDLHTVLGKIDTDYSTVKEFLSDLSLIWQNCREFNAEGSEISGWADTMEEYAKAIVEVCYGTAVVWLEITRTKGG